MENEFFFYLAVLALIIIVSVFILCMYLREFPRVKTNIKIDKKNNNYEIKTDLDKSDKKNSDEKSEKK